MSSNFISNLLPIFTKMLGFFNMTSSLNDHRNIYDVVKKEKLDVVNQPISQAHGLPNECYNSKRIYKNREKENI